MDIVALDLGGVEKRAGSAQPRYRCTGISMTSCPISETLTSNPAPGEYSIDGRYAYNIFSDGRDIPQAFASDKIAGNIKGVLTARQDNAYSFIGEAVI